jgi:hypothetical protein
MGGVDTSDTANPAAAGRKRERVIAGDATTRKTGFPPASTAREARK